MPNSRVVECVVEVTAGGVERAKRPHELELSLGKRMGQDPIAGLDVSHELPGESVHSCNHKEVFQRWKTVAGTPGNADVRGQAGGLPGSAGDDDILCSLDPSAGAGFWPEYRYYGQRTTVTKPVWLLFRLST